MPDEVTYYTFNRLWSYHDAAYFDEVTEIPFIDLLYRIKKKTFLKNRRRFRNDPVLNEINIRLSNVIHYFSEIYYNLEDLVATAIDLKKILEICADIQKDRELE